MMKLTVDVLDALGSCGTYTDRFRQAFPETDERYVDGVEPTPEVCAEHAEQFDWEWGQSTMLNAEGQSQYRDLVSGEHVTTLNQEEERLHERQRANIADWRKRNNQDSWDNPYDRPPAEVTEYERIVNEGREALDALARRRRAHIAAAFGSLVTRPELRSDQLRAALRSADELSQRRHQRALDELERQLQSTRNAQRDSRDYVEEYTKRAEEYGRQLPDLERRVATARLRFDERALRRAEGRLPLLAEEYEEARQRAEVELANARQRVEDARAAVAALDAPVTDDAPATDEA